MDRNDYIRRITIFPGKDGQYYWRAQGWNWQILFAGEGYRRYEKAVKAAEKLAYALEGHVEIFDKVHNTVSFS